MKSQVTKRLVRGLLNHVDNDLVLEYNKHASQIKNS